MSKKLSTLLQGSALMLGWAAIALFAPTSVLSVVLSAAFVLFLPGYFSYRLLSPKRLSSSWAEITVSVALSCLYLMLLGLALSVIGPLAGVHRPLSTAPLVGSIFVTTAAMFAALIRRDGQVRGIKLHAPRSVGAWIVGGVGALLPIVAALGAFALNNNSANTASLIGLGLVMAYGLGLAWTQKRRFTSLYPYAVFVMSLALLLANSLRGWFITGHDVLQEYQVFQLVSQHGAWSMSVLQNAYTACLSITILPTVLARVTGIGDAYVYKLLLEIVFAFMPVVLYLTLATFMSRQRAFLAAMIFVTFPTFFTDMSMLVRQEIAFLFLALFMYVAMERHVSQRTKSLLLMVLGLGMVLSHYSTSYVAAIVLLGAKLLELAMRALAGWRGRNQQASWHAPISWAVTMVLLLTVYLWNSQITNTSQNFAATVGQVVTSLPRIFDPQTKTGSGTYSLGSNNLTDQQDFELYVKTAVSSRDMPASEYYPTSVTNKYPLQEGSAYISPLTSLGKTLSAWRIPVASIFNLLRSGYAVMIEGLILVGLAILSILPRGPRVPKQFLWLGIASLGMIVLQGLLPAVINYGLLRLIMQSLIVLAPIIVIACYWLLGLVKWREIWRGRVVALVLMGLFLVNTGFLPALTGGYKPTLPTSNSGFYYDAYYTHTQELAGGSWLFANAPRGVVINSDEFIRPKLTAYFNVYTRPNLQPAAISKQAYVFLGSSNTETGNAALYNNGSVLYEKIPTKFLDDNKNLVYSSGSVKIYH